MTVSSRVARAEQTEDWPCGDGGHEAGLWIGGWSAGMDVPGAFRSSTSEFPWPRIWSFEENPKSRGKLAHFVLLSANPTRTKRGEGLRFYNAAQLEIVIEPIFRRHCM